MLEHSPQINITQSELAPRVADYFDNLLAQRDAILARYNLTPETAGIFCDLRSTDEDREKILALYEKMVFVIENKQIPPGETNVFVIPDAINPYADAFKQAGLPYDHPLCHEKKEMILDIPAIIAFQIQHYRSQGMDVWADDIEQHIDQLYEQLSSSEEQHRIETRIKAGYIPVVMPGRNIQLDHWEQSLHQLQPVYYENGSIIDINEPFIHHAFDGELEKMIDPVIDPHNSFLQSITKRPHLIWTKPLYECGVEIDREWQTTNLTYDEQVKKLKTLHKNHPELCDATDITPLEYFVLQSLYTETIRHMMEELNRDIENITPLDAMGYTRFIFGGLGFRSVPFASINLSKARLRIEWDGPGEGEVNGFRPVARS